MQSAVIVVIFDSEKVDAKNVVRKIKKVVAISGSRGGGAAENSCRTYSSALGIVM